ncbi:MAG: Ppx/GppA family phosphatase [Planctomycetes bacterium]|nr:Ppx/GppA family phosphatase [Planctomycetota bacterium]
MEKIRAAIDLGSNTTKLLVAEVGRGGALGRTLTERVLPTRSGKGIGASSSLREDAMARTIAVLAELAAEARGLGASEVRCGATSAIRDADNREAFLERVRRETGLEVAILSGAEEARYGFLGAVAGGVAGTGAQAGGTGRTRPGARLLVLDVGGGSAQFTVGAGAAIQWSRSYKLGAVRLTERFLSTAPTPPADRTRLEAHVRRVLAAGPFRSVPRGAPLLLVGGTAVTLAQVATGGALFAAKTRAVRPATGGPVEVRRAFVEELLERLHGMSVEERRGVPGMDPARADIIVSGLTVLAFSLAGLGVERVGVSLTGLRHGIAAAATWPPRAR